jgi:hypothetical protein
VIVWNAKGEWLARIIFGLSDRRIKWLCPEIDSHGKVTGTTYGCSTRSKIDPLPELLAPVSEKEHSFQGFLRKPLPKGALHGLLFPTFKEASTWSPGQPHCKRFGGLDWWQGNSCFTICNRKANLLRWPTWDRSAIPKDTASRLPRLNERSGG